MEINQPILPEPEFDQEIRQNLGEAAKWANIIAIVGIIFLVLFCVVLLIFGNISSIFSSSPNNIAKGETVGLLFTVLIIAAIYFPPLLFLYRFARKTKDALRNNLQMDYKNSIRNLKAFFQYIAILTIILILLYSVGIIIKYFSEGVL